jgi:hypothetical protein
MDLLITHAPTEAVRDLFRKGMLLLRYETILGASEGYVSVARTDVEGWYHTTVSLMQSVAKIACCDIDQIDVNVMCEVCRTQIDLEAVRQAIWNKTCNPDQVREFAKLAAFYILFNEEMLMGTVIDIMALIVDGDDNLPWEQRGCLGPEMMKAMDNDANEMVAALGNVWSLQ